MPEHKQNNTLAHLIVLTFIGMGAIIMTITKDPNAPWLWGMLAGWVGSGFVTNAKLPSIVPPSLLASLIATLILVGTLGLPVMVVPLSIFKMKSPNISRGILSRLIKSPDTIKLSSSSGPDDDSAHLPQALVGDIRIDIQHTLSGTVDDNLKSGISKLFLGEEADPLARCGEDDVDQLLAVLNPGLTAPEHVNLLTNPTSTVEQLVSLLLRGPFDLRWFEDPVLYLQVNPDNMTSALTSYSLTGRVQVHPYAGGTPKYAYYASKPAATQHSMSLGRRPVDAVFVLAGAASVLTELTIAHPDGTLAENIATAQQALKLAANYGNFKNAAPSAAPTQYMSRGYQIPFYRGRQADIVFSASNTCKTWAIGPG
jgi:hypothetical protein